MKDVRKSLEKSRLTFGKGGKLGFLHSTYDAFESFLFVPDTVTKPKGTHVRDCNDLKRVMIVVVVALLPALLFGMYNVGLQHNIATGTEAGFWSTFWFGFLKVLPMIIVSYVVGLAIEFASAQIRGHEVNEGFLVSGLIIPMIMPVDVPLWILGLSTAFAVIIGKEVFGGTGMNIWNPALIARAFAFLAYPSHMSGDKVWVAGLTSGEGIVDATTGATPLSYAAANQLDKLPTVSDMFFGFIPGSVGETSTLAILIGAVILIYTGIASWKIMVSSVAGALILGFLVNLGAEPGTYQAIPAWEHLLMGGFAFGTVFMATDPVTSAQTETGKWIYGLFIGMFTVIIRVFNPGYPEGMMLAILFMNTFAPLIDHYVVRANVRRRLKRAATK